MDAPVGREAELNAVLEGLRAGPVALFGPPGIGKSVLADAVRARWPGPVARGPDLRAALGLAPEDSPARALATRPGLLVILDGPEALPDDLGSAAVLAVSRTRLDAPTAVALGPLGEDDGVAVYRAAARRVAPAVRPDEAAVRALVRDLGGHPLALAVAGSRIRTLPPDRPGAWRHVAREERVAAATSEGIAALPARAREALARVAAVVAPLDVDGFVALTGEPAGTLDALLDSGLATLVDGRIRIPGLVRDRLGDGVPEAVGAWVAGEGVARLRAWRATGDLAPLEALRADLERVAAGPGPVAGEAALALAELLLRRGPVRDVLAGRDIAPDRAFAATILRARLLRRLGASPEALALLDGLPAPVDPVDRLLLATERAHHLLALGRSADAEALVPALRAPVRSTEQAVEAALAEALVHQRARRIPDALGALRRGEALAAGVGSAELRARLLAHLGALSRTADPEAGRRALTDALAAWEEVGDERWQGIVAQWAGLAAADAGDLEAALALFARSAALCARTGALAHEAAARLYETTARLEGGDLAGGRAALLAAERVPAPSVVTVASLRGHHGLLAHLEGDAAAAVPHYEAAVAAFDGLRRPDASATWRAFLALAAADAGRDPGLGALAAIVAGLGPGDRLLHAIVAGALGEGVAPADREAAGRLARSDLRLLLVLADRRGPVCDPGGAAVRLADGALVSLGNRPTLARVLAALAAAGPGSRVPRDALFAAGWPGQRAVGASGQARLHVSISTLRKLGVPIDTHESPGEGLAYALSPRARVGPVAG